MLPDHARRSYEFLQSNRALDSATAGADDIDVTVSDCSSSSPPSVFNAADWGDMSQRMNSDISKDLRRERRRETVRKRIELKELEANPHRTTWTNVEKTAANKILSGEGATSQQCGIVESVTPNRHVDLKDQTASKQRMFKVLPSSQPTSPPSGEPTTAEPVATASHLEPHQPAQPPELTVRPSDEMTEAEPEEKQQQTGTVEEQRQPLHASAANLSSATPPAELPQSQQTEQSQKQNEIPPGEPTPADTGAEAPHLEPEHQELPQPQQTEQSQKQHEIPPGEPTPADTGAEAPHLEPEHQELPQPQQTEQSQKQHEIPPGEPTPADTGAEAPHLEPATGNAQEQSQTLPGVANEANMSTKPPAEQLQAAQPPTPMEALANPGLENAPLNETNFRAVFEQLQLLAASGQQSVDLRSLLQHAGTVPAASTLPTATAASAQPSHRKRKVVSEIIDVDDSPPPVPKSARTTTTTTAAAVKKEQHTIKKEQPSHKRVKRELQSPNLRMGDKFRQHLAQTIRRERNTQKQQQQQQQQRDERLRRRRESTSSFTSQPSASDVELSSRILDELDAESARKRAKRASAQEDDEAENVSCLMVKQPHLDLMLGSSIAVQSHPIAAKSLPLELHIILSADNGSKSVYTARCRLESKI